MIIMRVFSFRSAFILAKRADQRAVYMPRETFLNFFFSRISA